MLDIAWTEILIIAVVAILVVGPRELPRMLRGIGRFMGQVRRTAGDFQRQFNDALREAELDDVKRGFDEVRKANPLNKFKDDLNPLKQAGDGVRKAVEDPAAPKPKQGKPAGSGATGPAAKPEAASANAETKPKAPAAKSKAPAARPKAPGAAKPPAKAGSGPAE